MPAVDDRGRRIVVRKPPKKKPQPKLVVRSADVGDPARGRPAPPPTKVRQFAHPQRKGPQKVFRQQERDEKHEVAKAREFKRTVARINVTPVPSPDARDTLRSAAQRARDREAAARSVRESRVKAVRAGKVPKPFRGIAYDKQGEPIKTAAGVKAARAAGTDFKATHEIGRTKQAAHVAPVLDVLEETTRPLHGVAAAARENVRAIKKEGLKPRPLYLQASLKKSAEAAARGIKNEDKATFSDVLGEAGWKPKSKLGKAAKGAVAFTADVLADPTTYLTGGTASIAAKTGEKAAVGAARKSATKGLTAEQTAKMAGRARTQAARKADQTKGITIKFAGAEIPVVRGATAKASKPVRRAATRVTPKRAREGGRAVGSDVNPNIAPVGVAKETSDKAIQATRTARAKSNRGIHEAQQQALGIQKLIGEDNYSKVIDALEAEAKGGKTGRRAIADLPDELRAPAVRLRSQFRHANRQRKQAGIKGGERKGYVPHHLTDEAVEALDKEPRAAGVGRRVIRPTSSRARAEQRSLAELRDQAPGKYSEDLPTLFADRKAEGATSVARAELNRRIADLGRTVKKGKELTLEKGESVYHVVGSDLAKVTDKKDLARLVEHGGKKGRYVVLNDDIVKRAIEGSTPSLQGPGIVKGLDKVQGGFKRLALATPGFHIRNLVGDTQNAYLGQSGHRIPGNVIQASRVLKAEGRRDKALRLLDQAAPGAATIKTARYGDVSYEQAAEQLSRHGAMRSGYTARELPELSGGQKSTLGRVRLPAKAKAALLNREDLLRVTTAIEALKKGATWEEAAGVVSQYHFDYGHLTSFERNIARRAAPFYTFSARNIPLQAKSLVSKPGKYANYEKLREEATKAAGMDEEAKKARALTTQLRTAGVELPDRWESLMTEWEQRNAGIPVSWRGKKFTVSFGFPLADLNELPGASGKGQLPEWFKKAMSMTTPVIKDPVEYFNNYSFFFRDQIERDNSPLVSAPSYVEHLPESVRKDLQIVKGPDKRTGKNVWKWPGKVNYLVKVVPGMPQYAQQFATEGTNKAGKGTAGKALQFMGVRAEPFDPARTATNLAYARQQEIQKRQAALRQQAHPDNGQPISADNPTPEYTKLSAQLKITTQIAYQGKVQQDYKILPPRGGPPKSGSSGRVKVPGVGGRVKVPGSSGGRVKVP